MTDGVYYDFTSKNFIYQDTAGLFPVVGHGNYVGCVKDTKGTGTPYDASAPSDSARRLWCGWNFVYPAFDNTQLQVTLPDLGSNCSIIIITPSGVSIQEGQAIGAGVYTLPAYPMRVFCIIDRALTAQEQSDIFLAYGTRYAINYDATIAARTLSGTTYRTDADLGWMADTDVGASGEVQTLINSLVNGDIVVFDAMYKISGNYDLSSLSNVTFRAATRQTCGLDCLDGIPELATANGLTVNTQPVFRVGSGFLSDGMKLTQDTIDPALEGMWGGGNKGGWFYAEDKAGFYLIDTLMDTMGWIGCEMKNTTGVVIARSRLEDLKHCLLWVGASDNPIVAHNLFTGGYIGKTLNGLNDSIFYDGIKTNPVIARGPESALVVENEYIDIVRDAIDTTGGFKDAIIDANILRSVGIPLDLKSIYEDSQDVANGALANTGVSMHYNLFDDQDHNALVLTTTWLAPDTPDPTYAAGPLTLFRNVFKALSGVTPTLCLNKNSKGVSSNQDTIIGEWSDNITRDIDDYTPSLVEESVITDPIYIP